MPTVLTLDPSDGTGSVNLVTNGGCEVNTTGWTLWNSSTLSRVTSQAKYGAACLQCAVTANNSGGFYSVDLAASTNYTATVWVKAAAGRALEMKVFHSSIQFGSNPLWSSTGNWQQKTWAGTTGTAGAYLLYVVSNAAYTDNIFVDGLSLVPTPAAAPTLVASSASVLTLSPS